MPAPPNLSGSTNSPTVEGRPASPWLRSHFGGWPGLAALVAPDGSVLAANRAAMPAHLSERFLDDSAPAVRQALAHVAASGEPAQLEVAMARVDGGPAWDLLTLTPTPDGVLALSVDIEARKREEERLRRSEALMVDTQGVAHLGVWEWDVTQPHANWNPELYRIYGLDPKTHTPSYEDYLTRVHPDDRQRVMDATSAVFHDHKPYSHDERIYRADGALRYLHTWAYPVLDANGKLIRLTGVCQDITDRKLAENAATEHAAQLARANAELEQFARLAAHDLQEPLRTIASFVQILGLNLEGKLDADSRQAMDFIEQAARRMKGQIADLLKYVKATSGESPRSPVNLGEALERVRIELTAAIRESGAQIRQGALPPVLAEPVEVEALLRNLLDNAIKFRGGRAPEISISARTGQGMVELSVEDNGIGIAPQHRERVFTVFQRLNRELPGSGIGLAVCKKIVERHGGRIWVEPSAAGGAAFHLTLPAAHAT